MTLSDDSANLSLPSSLIVPAGLTSGSVSATTAAVLNDEAVVVTATLNGVSRSALLTVSGNDLVGWWKLDETSDRVAADASGYGNHGTLVGNPVWTSGVAVGALQLNSVSYVQVPDSPQLRTEGRGISFGAWYYQNSAATGYLLGKTAYMLFIHQGAQHYLVANMTTGGVTRSLWASAPGGISQYENTWVHVFVIYDGTAIRTYLNGEQVASLPADGDILGNADPLAIGNYGGYGSWFKFGGKIDDVRIYRRALSPAEVRTLYLAPGN